MPIALVKIDVAAIDLRRSIRRIEQLVDGGSPAEAGLLWVFNVAVNPAGRRRDLRFWRPELLARANDSAADYQRMELDQVIAEILPLRRAQFHAGEVDQLFQIRPNTRLDYGSQLKGEKQGGRNSYSRPVLATFLKGRWMGHMTGVAR